MNPHIQSFLTPHLRRHRFSKAIGNIHKVFPLWPGGSRDYARLLLDIWDYDTDAELISYMDESVADVGFPTGAINKTTVVEVSSETGQDLIDELELEPGATTWTPKARYYFFNYIEPSVLGSANRPIKGLRISNDGEWIPYPGSHMDGHLVHWEHEPWFVGTHPMPQELLDCCVRISV